MSYSRNDPSSLSFGARLSRAERDASDAKRELSELKQALPNSKDLQAAALTADVIKQQRKSAKQTMARADVSLDELNGIDASVLTPTYKEQLRLAKRDTAWRELAPQQQSFQFQSDVAQARFDNWRSSMPQQDFAANNFSPEQESNFQKWERRQQSPAGRMWNAQQQKRAEIERSSKLSPAESSRRKSQATGIKLGAHRPL